jgi:hypothetical protein
MEGDAMNSDQLTRQFDQIESTLRREDRALARRFKKLQRADTRNDVAVFSLLTVSAVLLGAFWATLSVIAGLGGVAAYLASFLVDTHHRRQLARPPRE